MEQTTAERIGANVRAELGRAGMSQAALADALGLTQSTVSKRLLGKVPFDVAELHRVAQILGVDVAVLMSVTTSAQAAS